MKILNETTFMRALGEMAAELLRDTVDSTRPRIGHFTRSFTNQEEYVRTCLISAGMVNIACDQLNYALTYLSGYRPRKTFNGELITRADHIAFQIENIYLRLGMVPDRSLRLTNEVFRLGLPSRECGMRTVTDNQHLKGTPVRARLQTIDKIATASEFGCNWQIDHGVPIQSSASDFRLVLRPRDCESKKNVTITLRFNDCLYNIIQNEIGLAPPFERIF